MKPQDFKRFLQHIDLLTPAQIQDASRQMTVVRRRVEAVIEIEAKAADMPGCPHCRCERRQKWGRTRTNIQRYRCLECRKTFCGRTGSRLQYLHRPDLLLAVIKDMMSSGHPTSVRKLSMRLGVNKHTTWRWRRLVMEGLSGISSDSFVGIVEADETYQRESRKGSREWVRHLRNPSQHPAPPRHRWYEYGKKGIPMMRGLSRWQVPILTVSDRSGARRFQRIPGRSPGAIVSAMLPLIANDVVLCSDGHDGYSKLAALRGVQHYVIKTKPGQKQVSPTLHIQNINSLHSRYKDFTKPLRGPATKYLPGYLDWFVARVLTIKPEEVFRRV